MDNEKINVQYQQSNEQICGILLKKGLIGKKSSLIICRIDGEWRIRHQ